MLDHQILLLEKISYDKDLFKKEIIQSFKWLKSYEIIFLHSWLKKNYGKTHADVIRDVFEFISV
jgi:hypothetical protein